MDDFGFDRSDLAGTLLSMEFGSGGRILQIWAADPDLREESEEFQFVLPPMTFGEEFSEDYNPGTILLGARTNPDDPWILSRNTRAEPMDEGEDPFAASFKYDFVLLPEIDAVGRFYEKPGPVPQIVWSLILRNRGRVTLEIGELAFPFALNNLYEGFARTDEGIESLYRSRVAVHKFIGGAASYLFAQRLDASPPGLLITPGEDTTWELYSHVRASLHTPLRWEGIPVVYVHSRAAVEREEWGEWYGEHTSRVLEPGDNLETTICFTPASRDRLDGMAATMAAINRPTMRLFPAAVAPIDAGIGIDLAGARPTSFDASEEAELDTDSDLEGGYCYVRPKSPGPVTISITDTQNRQSQAHLLFTDPIETMIKRRAEWIVENQLYAEPGSNLDGAFLPMNVNTGALLTDPEDYATPFGVESILSDALFLAEKNTIYPRRTEVAALEGFVERFVRESLQNPATGAVGCTFVDSRSTAMNFGCPSIYPLVIAFHEAMGRIASTYGTKLRSADYYRCQTALSLQAMADHADFFSAGGCGLPLMARVYEIADGLRDEDVDVGDWLEARVEAIGSRTHPFAAASVWDPAGYEEVFEAAKRSGNYDLMERTLSLAFAARSTSPSWWWYGSDRRWQEDGDTPQSWDKGEMCLGPSTPANSRIGLGLLDRDPVTVPEPILRMAFGGLLGVWALVHADGAASHSFCPDLASSHFGASQITGTVGLSLYNYLRNASAFVLPSRTGGTMAFGCSIDAREASDGTELVVRPWDGIGKRVRLRYLDVAADADVGTIRKLVVSTRKRRATLEIENGSDSRRNVRASICGLWGTQFEVNGNKEHTAAGSLSIEQPLPPGGVARFEVKVTG